MSRFLQKVLNGLITAVVTAAMTAVGLYAAYALWDNNRIYAAAADVRADMIRLKPAADEASERGPSFEELRAINPDVCAWVSLDNTMIDHPVVQGETNLTYINTDVYGNFALAGSIFLDARSDRGFGDSCMLLYGHHMDRHGMFGDLDLYKEKAFFDENRTGMLIVPERAYELDIFACLLASASEDAVFGAAGRRGGTDSLLEYVRSSDETLYLREDVLDAIEAEEAALRREGRGEDEMPRVLALTTCSAEFTDARTVLLAWMKPFGQRTDDGEDDG